MADDRFGALSRPILSIPVPDDFPITWENPDDATLFWTRDRMHMPDPLSPLEFSINRLIAAPGDRACLFNGYLYSVTRSATPPGPEEQEEAQRREAQTEAHIAHLDSLWHEQWLPEIQTHIVFWDDFDLTAATLDQLLTHWAESIEHYKRLWELHFQIVVPAKLAIGKFDELYQDLFGAENAFAAYELLEGLPNYTATAGRELWLLSRRALRSPTIHAAVSSGTWQEVVQRLEQSEEGRRFYTALDTFLTQHGQRSERFGIRGAAWIEDPTPVLTTLRGYMQQPERDLIRELEDAAARRIRRIEEVRQQLAGYPAPVVAQFEFLLTAAQAGNVIGEDHNYWIDFRSTYCLRRVLLEFGRRLAQAEVIATPRDVLFLTLDEVLETITQLRVGTTGLHLADVVVRRQADFARFATLDAPPALGTPLPAQAEEENMETRTFRRKFMGDRTGIPSLPNALTGNAGSPGIVQGTARVIHTLGDAAELQPGEILVTITTMPAWTPLFAIAAAVVTDTGGILSHCAVVAREYGIPAVVGTGTASRQIKTGMKVEVDGHAGTVRVLD